jgi:uncharacterized protein (TIGR02145 family)
MSKKARIVTVLATIVVLGFTGCVKQPGFEHAISEDEKSVIITDSNLALLMVATSPEDGGTVIPFGQSTHSMNTPIDITATAAEGFRFAGWSTWSRHAKISDLISTTTTVTLSKDAAITANFRPIPQTPDRQPIPNVRRSSFTDPRDGQRYHTVKIGDAVWMAENLNYNIMRDSTCDEEGYGDNYEDGDNARYATYGRFYNWCIAQIACPAGWRLPNDSDWIELLKIAGGVYVEKEDINRPLWTMGVWEIAGEKLKSQTGWKNWDGSNAGNGTDDFGFSALPSWRDNIGNIGNWWSATYSKRNAGPILWSMWATNESVSSSVDHYNGGTSPLSVRCVRK